MVAHDELWTAAIRDDGRHAAGKSFENYISNRIRVRGK
jgi:hypothetical protein